MHCFLQKKTGCLILCVFKPHSFTFFLHGYYHGYSIDNGTVSFENYFIYSVYSFNAEKLVSFYSIISAWAQLQWAILLWSKQCMWQQKTCIIHFSLSLPNTRVCARVHTRARAHTHTHTHTHTRARAPDTNDMPIRQVAFSNNERTVNGETEIGKGRYRHRAWQSSKLYRERENRAETEGGVRWQVWKKKKENEKRKRPEKEEEASSA